MRTPEQRGPRRDERRGPVTGVNTPGSIAMKSLLLKLLIGAALMGTISACNTVAGVGEDISAAGRGLSRGAEQTKEKM